MENRLSKHYIFIAILKIKYFLNFFWRFHYFTLRRNKKFHNIHIGETCLIFGNGASLKKLDFSTIKKMPSIGCTYSLIDKRFNSFGLDYCAVPENYFFYPFRKDSYHPRLENNLIGKIMLKIIGKNKKTEFFCSLTNFYSFIHLRCPNVNYFYHFGDTDSNSHNLAYKFNKSLGALDVMIGIAQYMGFSKAILVGCDYLGDPVAEGHFYSNSNSKFSKANDQYSKRIKFVSKSIELLVLFPPGVKTKYFNWMTFADFFGPQKKLYTNLDLIEDDYLPLMQEASSKSTQLWM